jgi:hypothetical protein
MFAAPYGVVTFPKLMKLAPLPVIKVTAYPVPVGQDAPLVGNVSRQPVWSTSHTM